MSLFRFFGVWAIAFALGACAPSTYHLTSSRDLAALDDTAIQRALDLDGVTLGYHVVDVATGETLARRNENTGFPPASTAKIATMAAALGILGADFRFRTDVAVAGQLQGGVLNGDVLLLGDGDPLFSTSDLRSLAIQLADTGIRRITGRFVYASLIPSFPRVSDNQPVTAAYNQGISGLNVDFNRAYLGLAADHEVTEYVIPREAAGLVGRPDLPSKGGVDVPVNDPAAVSARLFRTLALQEGVDLPAPTSGKDNANAITVARVYSQPLIEIVRAGLLYSNNLVAETIGLAASIQIGAPPETLRLSALQTGLWLERDVPELDRFAPNLSNHSGLGTDARITPVQMTHILRHVLTKRFNGWRFDVLLPYTGGLEGFAGGFRQPTIARKVWAKSGNMFFINGLAGYIDSDAGRRLAFTTFLFDADARRSWDHARHIGQPLNPILPQEWRRRANVLQESLITRWISAY